MIKSLWDFTRVIWMNARRSAPAVRLPPTQAEQQIDLSFELACRGCYIHPAPVTDPKILKGRAEDYVSAPSSFIANAHNELWRFIREKTTCRKKVRRIGRGAAPPPPAPLNPPLPSAMILPSHGRYEAESPRSKWCALCSPRILKAVYRRDHDKKHLQCEFDRETSQTRHAHAQEICDLCCWKGLAKCLSSSQFLQFFIIRVICQ